MLHLEAVCDTALVSNISQSCVRLDAKITDERKILSAITVSRLGSTSY